MEVVTGGGESSSTTGTSDKNMMCITVCDNDVVNEVSGAWTLGASFTIFSQIMQSYVENDIQIVFQIFHRTYDKCAIPDNSRSGWVVGQWETHLVTGSSAVLGVL